MPMDSENETGSYLTAHTT